MLIIAALLLPAAWNTGENLLYIILGGVASLALLSGVLARANLSGIRLRREAPYAVHRGDPFLVHVTLENRKRLLPSVSLGIESNTPISGSGYVLRLPSRRAALLDVEHILPRRGVYALPDYMVISAFPFGFSEHRRLFSQANEIVVYPRVCTVHTASIEQGPGARIAPRSRSNDGDEYVSLREYIPGDDIRLIAWRVSARTGVWMVREMGFGNIRSILLLLDTSSDGETGFDERFEEAVESTASLAVTLLHRQYAVGVRTGRQTGIPMAKGTFQERHILDFLARVTPEKHDSAAAFEASVRQLKNEPLRLVCISATPEKWEHLRESGLVRILHPSEIAHA